MKAQDLKNSILQMAMEGKLVPQDPNDEPASVLLERIREEKEQLIKEKKIKRNNKESVIFRKNNHFYKKVGKKEPIYIDDEIPWEIPNSWEWCCMNQYLDIRDGTHDTPKYVKNGFPLVTSKNLDNGKIDFTSAKSIGEEDHINISKRSKVDDNDILFAMIGTIGNPVLVSKDREFSIKNVALFKPFIKETYMEYIFYYLLYVQNQMQKNASGAVQSFVSLTVLRNYYSSIPPLNEQKRIVKKIEELLPLIEDYDIFENELNKLNEEFPNKIKDSILQEAIQGKLVPQDSDDEPSSVLLERIKKEKEQLIKDKKIKRNKNESFIFKENNHFYEKVGKNEPICIDDEIPFNIPNSWQWCRLGDLVYNFGQKKPDQTFSYVDVGSIDNKNLKLNDEETILTKEEAPSRARKIIKEGAVIYSTVRPYLLNMCIIDKEFSYEPIASTAFAILNPFEGLYNKYLFYYLQSPTFINYVNSVMSGVAYPAINDKKLYNSLIALPPYKEQKRIVEMIEKLTKTIFEN